jgi:hypothetical protein
MTFSPAGLADEGIRAQAPDEGGRLRVGRLRLGLGQEMRQVRRRDDQDLLGEARFGQGGRERPDGRPRREPHDDGDDGRAGQGPLDEGDLDLDRVLFGEHVGPELRARGAGDLAGEGRVHAGEADRRLEAAVRPDGHAFEPDPVGWRDDDDGLEREAPDEAIGRGCGPPRINVAGVGRDEADDAAGRSGRGRRGHGGVDPGGELGRAGQVELAGERRRPDALGPGEGRDEESQRGQPAERSHGPDLEHLVPRASPGS